MRFKSDSQRRAVMAKLNKLLPIARLTYKGHDQRLMRPLKNYPNDFVRFESFKAYPRYVDKGTVLYVRVENPRGETKYWKGIIFERNSAKEINKVFLEGIKKYREVQKEWVDR